MKCSSALRTRRPVALLAAAALAVVPLSGCAAVNPQTAVQPYQAADGTNGGIGDEERGDAVLLRNMLVVVPDSGSGGRLLGAVVNQRAEDVTVEFAVLDAQGQPLGEASVTAEAGGLTRLGADGEGVALDGLKAKAGTNLSLRASTPLGAATVALPVLEEGGYYSDGG